MNVTFHVYLHGNDGELLSGIRSIAAQGASIMATVQELAQAVADLATAFTPLPQAINDLEAKVTAAMASAGISAADQQAVNAAFDTVKALTSGVQAAVTDATDGVDEAAAAAAATSAPTDPTAPADAGTGPT